MKLDKLFPAVKIDSLSYEMGNVFQTKMKFGVEIELYL